jgi:hypothetical protein
MKYFIVFLFTVFGSNSYAQSFSAGREYDVIEQFVFSFKERDVRFRDRYLDEKKGDLFTRVSKVNIDSLSILLVGQKVDTSGFVAACNEVDDSLWEKQGMSRTLRKYLEIYTLYHDLSFKKGKYDIQYFFSKMIFLGNGRYCLVRICSTVLGIMESTCATYLFQLNDGKWKKVFQTDIFFVLGT